MRDALTASSPLRQSDAWSGYALPSSGTVAIRVVVEARMATRFTGGPCSARTERRRPAIGAIA